MADSYSSPPEGSYINPQVDAQGNKDDLRRELQFLQQRLAQLENQLQKQLASEEPPARTPGEPETRHSYPGARPIVPLVSPPFPASSLSEPAQPVDWQILVPPMTNPQSAPEKRQQPPRPQPTRENISAEPAVTTPATPVVAESNAGSGTVSPPSPAKPFSVPPQTSQAPQAAKPVVQPQDALRNDNASEQKSGLEWENLIGGKWALWIGSFSLFLAVSSFLALTWKSVEPPPWVKIALGLGGGLSMIVVGGYWRQRTQRWFSEGLTGAGLAICYLSLWASVLPSLHVFSRETAFGSMAVLTALGVYLAVRYDAFSLVLLSTIGGFLTPVLLRSPGGDANSLSLLIYIAVLDAGIVAVSVFRRWNSVTWLSLLATVVLLLAWSDGVNFDKMRVPAFGFFTLYFLLFCGAACFHSLAHDEETVDSDLLLLFAASSLYALIGHALLVPLVGHFPGTFPLTLALFFASLGILVVARAPQNKSLRWSTNGLALLALTVALPVQLKQQSWLCVGWVTEAGILLLVSRRLQSVLMQRAGQIVAGLSLWPLLAALWSAPLDPPLLFLNARALPLLASVMMAGFVSWDARFSNKKWHDELTPLYGSFAVLGGAWLLAQETYLHFLWAGKNKVGPETSFAVAIVLSFYALAVFILGRRTHHVIFRLNSLIVALLAGALPLWSGFTSDTPTWMPFWNWRVLAFAVVTVVWLALGILLQNEDKNLDEDELQAFSFWPILAAVLALTGASLEVYFGFGFQHLQTDVQWQARAFFALVMLWSAAAVGLTWMGSLWRQSSLRALGYVIGLGAIATLLFDAALSGLDTLPLWNLRLGAFTFATGACILMALAISKTKDAVYEETQLPDECLRLTALLVLWGATQEIYETCRYAHILLGDGWRQTASYSIVILWALFAALLIHLKYPVLRLLSYLAALGSVGLLLFQVTAFSLATQPIFNLRFFSFAVLIASLAAMARRLRLTQNLGEWEGGLATQFTLVASLMALGGLTQETYETCRFYKAALGPHWDKVAWFAIAMLWQCGAFGLLVSGLQRCQFLLRGAAYLLGASGVAVLMLNAIVTTHFDWTPLFNVRGLTYALTFALWFNGALLMQKHRRALDSESEAGWIRPLGLFAIVILGIGLTQETFETCYFFREQLEPNWERWAQMAISVVWSVYGALLLIGGIAKTYQPLRLTALALLAVTVCKVFLFDLSFLDGPLRILSLAGLGVALIFISWLYGRFGGRATLGNHKGVPHAS